MMSFRPRGHRHARPSWWRRLRRWLRPADGFIGATAAWSPRATWDTVTADAQPEETAAECAERVAQEVEHARQLDEQAFARITRADFDAGFHTAELIPAVVAACDAFLAVMRERGVTDNDILLYRTRVEAEAEAWEFHRIVENLRHNVDVPAADFDERVDEVLREPTQGMPVITLPPRHTRELVPA